MVSVLASMQFAGSLIKFIRVKSHLITKSKQKSTIQTEKLVI